MILRFEENIGVGLKTHDLEVSPVFIAAWSFQKSAVSVFLSFYLFFMLCHDLMYIFIIM